MTTKLNLTIKILGFADEKDSNNPRLKYADWSRHVGGIAIGDEMDGGKTHTIEAGGSKNFFDGSRSTTIDGTTAFSVALSPLDPSRYRFTYTAGTSPGFRSPRSLTPNGMDLTFEMNANATLSVTSSASLFAAVQVADIVFIPNTSTGDAANVISAANSGYWQVLNVVSNTEIELVRFAGEDFSAQNETVTMTSNSQFVAYGSTGVQVGDYVDVTSGFSTAARKVFRVEAVTDTFFEVISTTALPAQTGIIPGATGLKFYTSAKRFVYFECDQDCVVRANGDTGDTQRVSPIEPGDPNRPGPYLKWGPTWSLTIVNKSSFPVHIKNLIFAE